MVDPLLIQRKLSELDEYLKQLREYQDISIENYRKQWKTQRVVERTLHIMIETCLDVANHIISDEGLRPPVSYSDTFSVLSEAAIINSSLSERLQRMAKFRNIIVHRYEEVEPEIVISILRRNLKDFELFKKAILNFLRKS
ncbi:MAG: type VII toxin-antitoxin system HepT family RNase toxin [Thermodesulfovibrionales bacterium]